MKNMNIQYECLDSQNDFHAQLHKGTFHVTDWENTECELWQDLEQNFI